MRKIKMEGALEPATIFAGLIASKAVTTMALDKIEFVKANPAAKAGAKALAWYLSSTQRNKIVKNLGKGFLVDAISDVYNQFFPADPAVSGRRLPSVRGRSTILADLRPSNHIAGTFQEESVRLAD